LNNDIRKKYTQLTIFYYEQKVSDENRSAEVAKVLKPENVSYNEYGGKSE